MDARANPTRRLLRTVLAVLLALAWVSETSSPASARKAPKRRGPLTFDTKECDRQREVWRNPNTGLTETVARTETCILFYRFDPLAENDQDRNYGVAWTQGKVEPRNGWCATRVTSHLLVSKDGKMHGHAPKRDLSPKSKRLLRVRLSTDANGTSNRTGTLSETIAVWPRLLEHSVVKRDGARIFRQRWTGSRGNKLLFASGVVLSWADERGGFPDAISSGLSYRFKKKGICS
ncbi:MAG: hypothetical protein M3124_06390 [Actinomycetota bacterium]|nr:hypothetical protein [Actinomycetota bacterium]